MEMRMNSRLEIHFLYNGCSVLRRPLSHAAETNALSVTKQYMAAWNEHNAIKPATYFDVEMRFTSTPASARRSRARWSRATT